MEEVSTEALCPFGKQHGNAVLVTTNYAVLLFRVSVYQF